MDAWRMGGARRDGVVVGGVRGELRERAGPVPSQTGGAAGAAHHLCSSSRKQERAKVSQLANGSESDPPIRTVEEKGGEKKNASYGVYLHTMSVSFECSGHSY